MSGRLFLFIDKMPKRECTSQQKLDTNIIFFFSKDPIIVQCYASSASLLFG